MPLEDLCTSMCTIWNVYVMQHQKNYGNPCGSMVECSITFHPSSFSLASQVQVSWLRCMSVGPSNDIHWNVSVFCLIVSQRWWWLLYRIPILYPWVGSNFWILLHMLGMMFQVSTLTRRSRDQTFKKEVDVLKLCVIYVCSSKIFGKVISLLILNL